MTEGGRRWGWSGLEAPVYLDLQALGWGLGASGFLPLAFQMQREAGQAPPPQTDPVRPVRARRQHRACIRGQQTGVEQRQAIADIRSQLPALFLPGALRRQALRGMFPLAPHS